MLALFSSLHLAAPIPFLVGWLADRLLGDPAGFHPIVYFGKVIAGGEKRFNRGKRRLMKGALLSIILVAGTFLLCQGLLFLAGEIHEGLEGILTAAGVFYCLAGKTLSSEVRAVFHAVEKSVDAGRRQVARIVGRDTAALSPQEIRTAALETLAENLSDGVIAPMCWFAVGGLPAMMAYKMVNTLDSMIGYRTERYKAFGCFAARLDDVANYIPARLTALLMLLVAGAWNQFGFVWQQGPRHASPNSGYPEAALAAILDCRFGGTHDYFGKPVEKPYIGTHARELSTADMLVAIRVNSHAELLAGILVIIRLLYI